MEAVRQRAQLGARIGAASGLVYGALELLLLGPVRRLSLDATVNLSLRGNLLVLVLYGVLGAAAGALLAAAVAPRREAPAFSLHQRAASAVTLLISALTALQVIAHRADLRAPRMLLAACAVCALVAVVRVFDRELPRWASPIAGWSRPWLASVVLLGTSFVCENLLAEAGRGKKLAYLGALVLVCAAASVLHERWARAQGTFAAGLSYALTPLVCLLALGSYELCRQSVLRAPRAETNEPAVGPNVVLIVMDTVRADHVSSYGYAQPTTPVLDALAKQSLLFEHSFATSNMTLSTHASLLTGQWVRQHGARYAPEPRPLPEGHTTLAETLREHGYRSAAVVSNFGYLGREWGLQRGFDYYDDRTAEPLLGECNVLSLRALLRERAAGFVERRAREAVYRDAAEIRRDVSHALDAVTGGDHPAPVFLFVNFMDAHSPYLPPAPYDTKFPGKLPKFDSDDENDLEREVMQGTRHVSERERAHVLSQYDGGLAYLDHELGALFDELKQRKLWDDTLLVVTGDHGEAFGERDIFGHGSSLYDDQIRVPLIVHAPHMKEGARKPELTSSVDFVPTVLAAAELPARPTLPGRDLLSAPTGGRVIFSEGYPNPYLISWNERWRSPLYGAIAWPYKLIVPEKGQPEAYDLHVDPAEVSPLPANLSMISELRAPLDALRDPTAAHGGSSAPSPKLNDAARDRLRALGYVQ